MAKTYTTLQGDTWDAVAFRLWGRETLMHLLVEANPDYGDVLVFGPDVVLTVPQVSVPNRIMDLPPWMEGESS